MNVDNKYLPVDLSFTKTICISCRISAVQMTQRECGESQPGLVTQLSPGTELQVCGEGFNDRTIKVRTNNAFFFVFREDLEHIA